LNQNNGSSQTDVFLVDKNGEIDANTPILWDFPRITHVVAYPVDKTPLKITGGRFTTIANAAESKYTYYARGIAIKRSNVVIEGPNTESQAKATMARPTAASSTSTIAPM